MAYDSYMLLIEAIKTSNSKDPQVIAETLRTLSYKGLTGTISFDENGQANKKQALIKTINTVSRQFEVLQVSTVGS